MMDKITKIIIPKVTVCVVTYNQEEYISQCLQSIVDQKTDFEFDVIVSDDCSTDKTPEIIKKFASKHSNIKPELRKKNVGPLANFIDTHKKATGCYIAHVDGDDLLLPGKLQKQNDILDAMPSISIVAHPVRVIGKEQIIGSSDIYPKIGNMNDLLNLGMYFTNSSTMYRLRDRFVHNLNDKIVDYYKFIELSSRGDIYLCDYIYGEYRIHNDGISKNKKYFDLIQNSYNLAFELALNLGCNEADVERAKVKRRVKVAISALLSGDLYIFRKYITTQNKEPFIDIKHRILSAVRNVDFILEVIVFVHKYKLKSSL